MGICVSCRRRERKAPEKLAGLGAGGPAKGTAALLLPRRADPRPLRPLPIMANSISNIKMTNPIKGMVSKRRKRYIKDGFNLDLAYITDRLIAMGFPAEKLEGVYRNHIDEVYRFLEQMHKDHYKIYNLCSERSYDSAKFHERVERYAFDDHTPPNMELIMPFCEDVHKWLSADPRNVAAVHCKAGKGRTGTMICCYLLYSRQKATADEALKFYGTKRTHDEKGVTIPSQRRYVEYFASLLRSQLTYSATKVHIRELIMSPPPMLNGGQCSLELTVSQAQPPLKAPSGCHEVRRGADAVVVSLTHCTPMVGDVRVDVCSKPKVMRKEKLFHFWFNTFFLAAGAGNDAVEVPAPPDGSNLETFKLTLNKWQLDDAHKDKQHKLYSEDFKVELIVQKLPSSSTFSGAAAARARSPPSSSASSCSEPEPASDADADADEHWDSGERASRGTRGSENPSKLTRSAGFWGTRDANDAPKLTQTGRIWDSKNTDHKVTRSEGIWEPTNPPEITESGGDWEPHTDAPQVARSEEIWGTENPNHTRKLTQPEGIWEPTDPPRVTPSGGIWEPHNTDQQPGRLYTDIGDPDGAELWSSRGRRQPARLSLGDVRASWREFSGKFTERKKRDS